MTLIEKIRQLHNHIVFHKEAEAISLLHEISIDLHLANLYPLNAEAEHGFDEQLKEQGMYKDTMGRLKQIPIEQKNECTNLCSCCKVME